MQSNFGQFFQLHNQASANVKSNGPQPATTSKKRQLKRKYSEIDRENDSNNNETNQLFEQAPKKPRKKDKSIPQNKKDITNSITLNEVSFQDDTTLPNALLRQHCK